MGHYTSFQLEVIKNQDPDIDYEQEIADQVDYNPFKNSCKWYDSEKDMREFSKKYPDVLFKLSGQGETNEDMQEVYFLDGKMQMCPAIITYDKFDEAKLT